MGAFKYWFTKLSLYIRKKLSKSDRWQAFKEKFPKKRVINALCIVALASLLVFFMAEYNKTLSDKLNIQADLSSTKHSLERLQAEYDSLESDFISYQKEMKPYEEMTAAQAQAEKAKAEQEKKAIEEAEAQKKAAEEAAAAQKAAEEEAARAAEEAKGYETGITYDQLARTPDDFIGKKIKFSGKVLQVIEGTSKNQIRLAVNEDYDTVLYCEYDPSIVPLRILEDDIITIYGVSVGTISYQSTLGGTITIPGATIDKIDQ